MRFQLPQRFVQAALPAWPTEDGTSELGSREEEIASRLLVRVFNAAWHRDVWGSGGTALRLSHWTSVLVPAVTEVFNRNRTSYGATALTATSPTQCMELAVNMAIILF
jgi:hypothetical protein